jgi:DNA end-binding protein Ku
VPDPEAAQEEHQEPGARGFWSGTLSFGLVSIPVSLYTAHRYARAGLRQLDQDGTALQRRYYCPADGQELSSEHLVRGYQLDNGDFVTISDEELEKLEPEKSRDIDLRLFVPAGTVDPAYYDHGYFLVPAAESTKAYRLLAEVMERTRRIGIATFVMRGREYLVAIEAHGGLLQAETLRFHDELRTARDVGLPVKPPVQLSEVDRYRRAIEQAAADELDPAELRDDAAERLRGLAEQKRRHRLDVVEISEKTTPEQANVIDLMQVLKRSLAAQQEPPPTRAAAGLRTGRSTARSVPRKALPRPAAAGASSRKRRAG